MRVELIENYLDNLIPNPKCELEFSKDYELLISIMLSAQTTDKRVNKVTRVLFKKYDSLEKLKNADLKDLKNIVREPVQTPVSEGEEVFEEMDRALDKLLDD